MPELILGLIVFFLLFAVLGKVLLPRIEKTLAERHDKTDGGLARAEAARAEAERLRKEFQSELAAARHEAAAIRQTAAEEGAALVAALRAEGLQQREQLVAEAHVQLAADKVLAEAELREDVIKVATELASRVVGEPLADLPATRAIAEEYRNRATV
ncbi:ATP synthase F0 subunit B [Kitasatospora cheerisanensis KCTC 2395]|uniref:ATP synthase subunit b n=1 Tax=Kitasatospora cheerisanensis KCTC 2395 TaxID=1348663 RepID=A0A066Z6M7_9ACTN|nr:ATP synthase F0 subunit B [Kitasatospora cheerisanensis KCTC 2395]